MYLQIVGLLILGSALSGFSLSESNELHLKPGIHPEPRTQIGHLIIWTDLLMMKLFLILTIIY